MPGELIAHSKSRNSSFSRGAGQPSHVRRQATVKEFLSKMDDIHNSLKLAIQWTHTSGVPVPLKPWRVRRSPATVHPMPTAAPSQPTTMASQRPRTECRVAGQTISRGQTKSGGHHRGVVMATASGRQSTNYERTSANSFSKNCFGLAPITVFFTSPSWNR